MIAAGILPAQERAVRFRESDGAFVCMAKGRAENQRNWTEVTPSSGSMLTTVESQVLDFAFK